MNRRPLRHKLHQHLGARTQTFVDPSDDLLLDDKLGGPVGRLKDIGNVVLDLIGSILQGLNADHLGPTVDYLTWHASAEACQLDQLATVLEPQQ